MSKVTLYSILILCLVSSQGMAAFLSLNTGYEQFGTKEMRSNRAFSRGTHYQFELGAQMRHSIITFYLKQSDLKTKILHDETNFEFNTKDFSYGLKASFTISKKNYLSVGYNISRLRSDFSNISLFDSSGIKQANGLDDVQHTNGIVVGAGRNFYKKRKLSIFGEFNHVSHANIKASTQSLFFGLRYKVNIRI